MAPTELVVSPATAAGHVALLARALGGLEDCVSVVWLHPHLAESGSWQYATAELAFEGCVAAAAPVGGGGGVPASGCFLRDEAGSVVASGAAAVVAALLKLQPTPTSTPTSAARPTLALAAPAARDVEGRLVGAAHRAGYADNQKDYASAAQACFDEMNKFERELAQTRFLGGASTLSLDDCWLFAFCCRVEPVYFSLFKCSVEVFTDATFPNLRNFMRDVFTVPGVAPTVQFDHIREHFWWNNEKLTGRQIVPKGFAPDLYLPNDRHRLQAFLDVAAAEHEGGVAAAEADAAKKKAAGEFVRGSSGFRNHITADGSSGFKAEPGRYHLYIANNCPWCHRCVLMRAMKGLEKVISMDTIYYRRDAEKGWQFVAKDGCVEDSVHGVRYITDIYEKEGSKERSVPVLYDKKNNVIVSNESAEIIRMFNEAFSAEDPVFADLGVSPRDFYPAPLQGQINWLNSWIYPEINNGAYRAGFAKSQEAYDKAFDVFFRALDRLETILSATGAYLTGPEPTEADVRLFPTLFRFDAVYFTRFRLGKKRLAEYPALQTWLLRVYSFPGVSTASSLAHCKNGYFGRTGLETVPLGPRSVTFA